MIVVVRRRAIRASVLFAAAAAAVAVFCICSSSRTTVHVGVDGFSGGSTGWHFCWKRRIRVPYISTPSSVSSTTTTTTSTTTQAHNNNHIHNHNQNEDMIERKGTTRRTGDERQRDVPNDAGVSRRGVFARSLSAAAAGASATAGAAVTFRVPLHHSPFLVLPAFAAAADDIVVANGGGDPYNYRGRDRRMNADALIREDYWYMMGATPPRVLNAPLKGDDPKWNAFGSCESTTGGSGGGDTTLSNPCTYVSLKQRIPAYSKYAGSIAYGAGDMRRVGQLVQQLAGSSKGTDNDVLWNQLENLVTYNEQNFPPPLIDAELKMILLATALTTSPNFPLPSRELYVARYYANECHFASGELSDAIRQRDVRRARAAWEYGRDGWNSYFQVVNRSITPKVGDQFVPI